ncbi:MAG TPA: Rieske 2Fe-2S domain-containing protein [Stellaceae bacterium]|jgi:phthalate 4,5-dioxygenase oxygenase subunit|nr:Rieske 2Fe-2S domain-containing protein [Stellaceae bacterium]
MTPEENDLLCRIEGDAPMGQLMRRHWIPACLSEEVAERDGAPVRTRLLGEDLVAFRDTEGKLGVLGEHCPHRQASLAFGRNEECGLRCLYHGWKFDVGGNVTDMSCEPEGGARMLAHIKHKAYPVREGGGFVWIYMGPREAMPEFAPPAWAPSPTTKISIVKMHTACNWAQPLEGAIDSAHSSSLHSTDMPAMAVDGAKATEASWPRPSTDKAPRMAFQLTRFGFRYAAIRKPIVDADTHDYVRITLFVAPFTVLIPPNDRYNLAQMLIPIDDENTMFYWVAWHETRGIDQTAWRRFCAAELGIDLDADYRKRRNLGNGFLQDRAAMKQGDFTGIKGIPAQDMAMWESMGAIVDRSHDYLGASDIAVSQFRRQMVAAAKQFAAGGPAIGTVAPRIPQVKLASFEGIVPKSTDWRRLAVSAEELALADEHAVPAQ